MAVAVDASTPAVVSGSTTTITTTAFTTPANVFLLAMRSADTDATASNAGTVTGAGLTWVLLDRKGKNQPSDLAGGTSQGGVTEMWGASSAAALTSVTVSCAEAVANNAQVLKVVVLTGAETTWAGAAAANAAATGLATASLTTTVDLPLVFASLSDWNAVSGTATPGSGQTLIDSVNVPGSTTSIRADFWRQTSNTTPTATSVTNNLTAPTGQAWNEIILEIRPPVAVTLPKRKRVKSNVPTMRAANF